MNYDVKRQLQYIRELKQRKQKLQNNYSSSENTSGEEEIPQKNNKNNQVCQDLSKWKRQNGYDQSTKIYILKGQSYEVRNALEERKWVENPDFKSLCFDFKWTNQVNHIQYENLRDFQIVNHFQHNECCTSKYGLAQSLKSLIFIESVDIDQFYPRCFDLADQGQYEDWVEDYKFTKNEQILKKFIAEINTYEINPTIELQIKLAANCCRRRFLDFYDQIDFIDNEYVQVISPEEWNIISSNYCDLQKTNPESYNNLINKLNGIQFKQNNQFNKMKSNKKNKQNLNDEDEQSNKDEQDIKITKKYDQLQIKKQLLQIAQDALQNAQKYDPQYHLNGSKNIWIVKPIFLSRGRGIKLFDNFGKIMDHIIGKETQYVAQKYIENPLLIENKKFDIRQWVFVQDFCPPKIWIYNEFYIRICASEFTNDNIQNRFIHLTNNCVQKLNSNKQSTEIMWTQQQFQQFLKIKTGNDFAFDEIRAKQKEIIIWSLKSVADIVGARKNSAELFGYDFMIDENYNPWLIEINSSPSMEYSTDITARLCKSVQQDLVKVLIDYSYAKKGQKNIVDTGGFNLVYKGESIQPQYYNANKSKND